MEPIEETKVTEMTLTQICQKVDDTWQKYVKEGKIIPNTFKSGYSQDEIIKKQEEIDSNLFKLNNIALK